MIEATKEQHEQINEFFYIIRNHLNDVLLCPCLDKKTGIIRLALCIGDRENNLIYVKGLYFLPNDPIFKRFELLEPDEFVITEKSPGLIGRIKKRIVNYFQALRL